MRSTSLALLLLTALALAGSDGMYESAKQKIERIASDQAERGSTVTLSTAEVNALVNGKIREEGIEGVRNPKVVLAGGKGTWSGIVDFEKLPQLESLRNNFLLSSLLKGESPIAATLTMTSGAGQATVDVESVTIGETTFEGSTLGYLVQAVILDDYPEVELGKPFELEHNVERIDLKPSGIAVKIRN